MDAEPCATSRPGVAAQTHCFPCPALLRGVCTCLTVNAQHVWPNAAQCNQRTGTSRTDRTPPTFAKLTPHHLTYNTPYWRTPGRMTATQFRPGVRAGGPHNRQRVSPDRGEPSTAHHITSCPCTSTEHLHRHLPHTRMTTHKSTCQQDMKASAI
jgi:hypothetical protein